ncbi:hypothetical protein [Paenibacillus aceti]|uniref:Flagellin Flp1-like domain-containing protein n=1 Tax=Paenibacillus aceti TaxID=1820010 RepID=A0ABQ1VWU5_9BACL|nr:hypothetical protein [Paenibacillus aceti]GGG02822.1 hypothetical protein GCM10010913_25700 [Paenibacillus aceti]
MGQKSQRNNERTSFWRDEQGDIGIKQIAITVGVIVVIGIIIGAMQGQMGSWLTRIFDTLMGYIDGLIQ